MDCNARPSNVASRVACRHASQPHAKDAKHQRAVRQSAAAEGICCCRSSDARASHPRCLFVAGARRLNCLRLPCQTAHARVPILKVPSPSTLLVAIAIMQQMLARGMVKGAPLLRILATLGHAPSTCAHCRSTRCGSHPTARHARRARRRVSGRGSVSSSRPPTRCGRHRSMDKPLAFAVAFSTGSQVPVSKRDCRWHDSLFVDVPRANR